MPLICIYDADCMDFTTNGLGVVTPESCEVTETLNGTWEVTLVHPIDKDGKWARLTEGRILRVPVPAGKTPAVNLVDVRTETLIYRVKVSDTYTKIKVINAKPVPFDHQVRKPHYQPTITKLEVTDSFWVKTSTGKAYLRSDMASNSPAIATYVNGTEVIVLSQEDGWMEVACPDGQHGYMASQYLEYVRTEPIEDAVTYIESKQLRDQPFRIYRTVPELDKVTVYARHVFYDLMDNFIKTYAPEEGEKGAAVLDDISSYALSEHPFSFYSDIDSTADDYLIEGQNPVDALLGEDGFIDKFGGELARDGFDVYLVKRVGQDTPVRISEGKNLKSVSYDVDATNVVTRIIPTGEDKDGNVLYLPEGYLDSENISNYIHPKWSQLAVSEAKESTDSDSPKTQDECFTLMREAAQAEFDAGCDLPDITVTVDFLSGENAEEFKQYEALQQLFIGDAVRVAAKKIGVAISMRMTEYTYDCMLKRYSSVTLGTIADTVEGNVISTRQLASGSISGSKIAVNAVGSGQLQSGSVGSLQVKLAAIETAHVQDAAITTAKIADASITSAKIGTAVIGTANIQDAAITSAKIGTAAVDSANIKDAAITSAKIQDAAVGSAQIGEGVIHTAHIGDGEIQSAKIGDAQITSAKIASAAVDSAQIKDAAITTAKIADAAVDSAQIKAAAVETAHIKDANVTTAKIVDAAITSAKIADLSVTSAKIDDLAVTTAKIAQAAIGSAQIADAAIETAKIALGAITSALIKQGAVGTAQIADASITDAKVVDLSANSITAGTLSVERLVIHGSEQSLVYAINNMGELVSTVVDTIDGYVLTERTITADKIVANAITANEIASKTITANEILAGTITGNEIAAATIQGANVKAGTLTTNHVASDFGEKLNLESNESVLAQVKSLEERDNGLQADMHSELEVTAENIRSEVASTYALSSDLSQTQQQLKTLSEQTDDNFTWSVSQINNVNSSLSSLTEATEEQFKTIQTYMTFAENGLTIGKSGNPFTFRVVNDRLSFYMNESEVAYLSDNKLYVTEAEILTRMQLGLFAFEPQTNGNMSIVYTGGEA